MAVPLKPNLQGEEARHLSAPEVYELREYSDLEVDGTKHFSDPQVTGLEYSTLEFVPGSDMLEGLNKHNLQAYHPAVGNNKDAEGAILYDPDEDKAGDQAQDSSIGDGKEMERRICGLKRWVFWVVVSVTSLVVIGAVVGGAVGVSVNSKSNNSSSSGGGSGNTTTPSATNGIRSDSRLAALARKISSTRYQYRVYYQDVDNSLKESAYDSSSGSWTVSKIVNGSNVAAGTSLAASSPKQASSDSATVDIDLYYFNPQYDIAVISASEGNWSSNKSYTTPAPSGPDAGAELGAYYLGCSRCPNTTLLAYASNGSVVLYNDTSAPAWSGTSVTIIDDAHSPSEVSFQPYSIEGYADQLDLYYQRTDGALVLTSWFSDDYQRDHNENLSTTFGWQSNGNNGIVGTLPPNTSFTALYFGNNQGSPAYVEVLVSNPLTSSSSSSSQSLNVFEWTNNTWNSETQLSQLGNVTQGTAVAAHYYMRAYALVDGVLVQFAVGDDGSWSRNANVPTL